MDLTLLNWVKEAGIAVVVVIVMGRVIYLLAEAAIIYLKGLREDNKERNAQFARLLGMSAGEMELTRKAIEHMTRSHRGLGGEVASLGERLVEGDTLLRLKVEQTAREAVADLTQKLDHSQTHIIRSVVEALQPALDKLDELGSQLAEARADLLDAFEKAVQDKLTDVTTPRAVERNVELSSPSEN